MRIAVIGLGKLGSPLAAVLASKGHTVIGVDLNQSFVDAINEGRAPVVEPQLQELIDKSRDRLSATTDFAEAISQTEISFVIVPTPSDARGVFTNKFVLGAVEKIGAALRKSDHYHVVNITSTVMPGSTGGEIRACLEQFSGRTVGDNLGLTYNPEFIALGSVVRDMLFPDMLLIGESDKRAGDTLQAVYEGTVESNPPFQRMNLVNAEITKISVNTYVTTKISYANMLSELCDRLPEADVDVVTDALGRDSRIGRKYIKGALGYGGPCFPRDNIAFSVLARSLGAAPRLAEATDEVNKAQVKRLADKVAAISGPKTSVAVLGMSYKPGTPVIEESQGVMLARALAEEGRAVTIFDPMAADAAKAVLPVWVEKAETLETAVAAADVIVIATAWDEFRAIPVQALARGDKRVVVLDCWRSLDPALYGPVVDLHHLGKGPARPAADGAGQRAQAG
ncbi:MAG: UDP-glucose/GDP-mannose dehydrogenase family protein [Hyphomonadaceae bacterium]